MARPRQACKSLFLSRPTHVVQPSDDFSPRRWIRFDDAVEIHVDPLTDVGRVQAAAQPDGNDWRVCGQEK